MAAAPVPSVFPQPVENGVAEPPMSERPPTLREDIHFSDSPDDTLSSKSIQDADKLLKTPRGITQVEQILPVDATATDRQA